MKPYHADEWMERAACRQEGMDPDWWSEAPGLAKHVCQIHCPVRARCDAWAEDGQWMALVIGGYLRSAGSMRSNVQPVESRQGCPTCLPGTAPVRLLSRSYEVRRANCRRCGRLVPLYPNNASPMPHKYDGQWCR